MALQSTSIASVSISQHLLDGSIFGALCSIARNEAMNIIRKGQICWLPKGDVVGQKHFIERIFGIAV